MAYVRRATVSDAIWQRAWTADALVDLAAIHAAGLAKHGDVAYVTATTTWYAWMDDGTWKAFGGGGGAWGSITGILSAQTDLQTALDAKAALASPALTGTPTAPTAAGGTNTTQIATTAFTRSEIAALIASSPATLDTLNELALALGSDPSFATTMATALAAKAAKYWTVLAARTDTGAVNNWAPALAGHTYIPWNGAADATITGLAGGVAGQLVTVKNITTTKVAYFTHQSGSSSAGNQYRNLVTSAPTPVAAGGFITYLHNGTDWVYVGHDQGAWIVRPFSAGNYVGEGGTTVWTVEAGDIGADNYRIDGKMMIFSSTVRTSTVTFSASGFLMVLVPGGFTVASPAYSFALITENGTSSAGSAQAATDNYLYFSKPTGAAFANSTNAIFVRTTSEFEVV